MTPHSYYFVTECNCPMCGAPDSQQRFIGRRLSVRQGWAPGRKAGVTVSLFKCTVCALVYCNPRPVPLSLGQHYDVPPEEYWNASYFDDAADNSVSLIEQWQRIAGAQPRSARILDVGAGIGKAMRAFQEAGFDVFGIEPSPAFRDAAVKRTGIDPSRIQLASVETADLPKAYFDFINLAAVLEHISDPARALERVLDWIKPGGLAYVEVPSSSYLQTALVNLFYRFAAPGFVIHLCPMHSPFHLYEFGLKSFELHGQAAGYTIAQHQYYPCGWGLPRPLLTVLNKVMTWTDSGMQLAVWIRKGDASR